MLRERAVGESLWEAVLPAELRELPAELAKVDEILVEELNAELLQLAVERKLLRSRRLRVDTTVVEADTRYPTDSGLCAHAVSRLTRLARRVKAVGLAPRTHLRDRRRSVGKRVRAISAARVFAGRGLATIDRLTAEIAERAKQTVREARALARIAR